MIRRDDLTTLAAVGVLAATVAAAAHEAMGHGGMCLAQGGEITLLTSIVFRCRDGGGLTDLAGPLGSLACGAAAVALVRPLSRSAAARLFLLVTGSIALLWFFGQLAQNAIAQTGDWAFAAKALRWPPLWRPAAIVIGIAGYLTTVRFATVIARGLADGPGAATRLLAPYLAAAASAVVAGFLWRRDPAGSAWEGLKAVGLAPLGYLWAVGVALRTRSFGRGERVAWSWAWVVVATVAFVIFALSAGRGLGRLA